MRGDGVRVVVGLLAFVLTGAVFAGRAVGFPGSYDPTRFQVAPDAVQDWLTARAAFDRADPYRPIDEIGAAYGVSVPDLPDDAVHPRFPGAFLLQAPLLALPVGRVVSAVTALNLVMLSGMAWAVWRRAGSTLPALSLPVLVLTPIFLELVAHGSQIGLLAGLLTVGWWVAMGRSQAIGGVLLGTASVLRGFPLLAAPALWLLGRRSAAMSTLLTFGVVNVVGGVVAGVGVGDVVGALGGASDLYARDVHNGSLAGVLMRLGAEPAPAIAVGAVVLGLGWVLIARRIGTGEAMFDFTVPVMLLASPLSWPVYHFLLLPAAGSLARRGAKRELGLVMAVAVVGYGLWAVRGAVWSGIAGFAVSAAMSLTAWRLTEPTVRP